MSQKRKLKRGRERGEEGGTPPPIQNFRLGDVRPLTRNQDFVFRAWDAGKNLFLHGMAGTGKTFISLYLGIRSALGRDDARRVYIVRSAVPTRDMGFLPGKASDKSEVYEAPYRAICSDLFGRADAYEVLKQKRVVEFVTTSYIRGITLSDCVVIVDEVQNLTLHELDSVITRAGENCRFIFLGDGRQTDFLRDSEKAGLAKFMSIIGEMHSFELAEFGISDICRSEMVKDYIIEKDRQGIAT